MTADAESIDQDRELADKVAASMARLEELIVKTEQYAAGNQRLSRNEAMKHLEGKHRGSGAKTEEQEDADMVQDEMQQEEKVEAWPTHFDEQPGCIVGGQMRDYQIEALNWMIGLHDSGLNGILADEMGLGKTLQSISVLGYLQQYRQVKDPHIVIVPKSTLGNWVREFKKWCPSLRVLRFHGMKDDRAQLRGQLGARGSYDVVVTTYEMVSMEKGSLGKIPWHFMYIDEAHRIKNECSLLSQVVRTYKTKHRLLITGTPLQNNLHELWALLNFLLPNLFSSSEDFNDWFSVIESTDSADSVVKRLHRVLRPFLLRRLKSDVETTLLPKIETILHIGLTTMQREWYTRLLMKDIDALNSAAGSRVRFLNLLMQLRKTCNHPYLFEGAEPGPPFEEGPHLVENAGKMILLDKLLQRLHARGSRVLIFSQMTRMLDIIEDYLRMKGHDYCRIDGQTSQDVREEMMDSFNAPNSAQFVFLLSTRAGGLGINLQTADTVILYDSDWNPQMDLQAQDRAHRIGQKKQVHVYRLVTEGTVEEKIVERAYKKLFLDALVIQQGRLASQSNKLESRELSEMVRFGADQIFRSKESSVTDEDIDAIMEKGIVKTETITSTLKTDASFNLANFSLADNKGDVSIYNFDDKDFKELRVDNNSSQNGFSFISMPKRDRKQVIEMDEYWPSQTNPASKRLSLQERSFKPSSRYDFQFFDVERIHQLEEIQFEGRKKLKLLTLELKDKERNKKVALKEKENPVETIDLEATEDPNVNGQTLPIDRDQDSQSRRLSLRRKSQSIAFESDPMDSLLQLDKETQLEELERLAGGLSESQKRELQRLEDEGFGNWKTRDFQNFIKGSELHGRDSLEGILRIVQTKSLDEIKSYHSVFWQRYKEIRDWKKYIQVIERGEARLEKLESFRKIIQEKVAMHHNTMEDITFDYVGKNPMKGFTEEEDRFLFYSMSENGYGNWEEIKASVRRSWMFRFDWFLKSRPASEIGKRCDYLLTLATKDVEAMREASKSRKRKSSTGSAKRGRPAATKKASAGKKRGRPLSS